VRHSDELIACLFVIRVEVESPIKLRALEPGCLQQRLLVIPEKDGELSTPTIQSIPFLVVKYVQDVKVHRPLQVVHHKESGNALVVRSEGEPWPFLPLPIGWDGCQNQYAPLA
jgi:hypothetical protein